MTRLEMATVHARPILGTASANFSEVLERIDASGFPTAKAELSSLSRERNPELFYESLLAFGVRQEQAGHVELAARVYAAMANGQAAESLPLQQRAREQLQAILGQGAIGSRAEFLLRRLAQESCEPSSLLAMGAAGALFKVARLGVLSRLAASPTTNFFTRGLGARALASVAAFSVEAPAFTLTSHMAAAALGRSQDWNQLGRQMASSYLVLGGMRLAGWAAHSAGGGLFGLLGAENFSQFGISQAGMLGGILLGRRLEEGLGLRERQGGATTLIDSLALLLQFNVAGNLSRHALGARFQAWEQGIEFQTGSIGGPTKSHEAMPPLHFAAVSGVAPRAPGPHGLFQPIVLMQTGNGSGSSQPPPASGTRLSGPPESTVLGSEPGSSSTMLPPPSFHPEGTDVPLELEGEAYPRPGSDTVRETQPPPDFVSEEPDTMRESVPEVSDRRYGSVLVSVDGRAGLAVVQRARTRMAPFLKQLRETLAPRADQPWFIAGISDGMGFHSAIALMEAGVKHLVGAYYEPEALLTKGSAVHLGRLANVEGLRLFAQERAVHFDARYEDLVLPQWGKVTRPLPENVHEAIRDMQRRSGMRDLNFANSIAFARWISPSPGVEQRVGIPSLNLEGQVVLMDMRPYHQKNYEGTLDSMGRNHGALLESLQHYFGPQSTSFFFTWAGGSQNMRVLHGIYGGGALGHAKEIGETETLRFHLQSQAEGFAHGYHKIVRFPDFPSFALFGIPGGGAFGMIARHVLEGHGCYADMSELAPRAYFEAFGGQHNLRNPAAQIELDVPESYHLAEIEANLNIFYHRVEEYRREHPEWNGKEPLNVNISRQLLRGLVNQDYAAQIPQATE